MAFPVTKELLFWVTGEIGKVDRKRVTGAIVMEETSQ